MSEKRPGIVPVLGNARTPHSVIPYMGGKSQWLFQDLSMPDQATAFINQLSFYSKKWFGDDCYQSTSERWSEGGDEALFNDAESKIYDSGHLELIERIDLSGLERHSVIVVRKL